MTLTEIRELIDELRNLRHAGSGVEDTLLEAATALTELLARVEGMEKALRRIEQNFGHCGHCGTSCEGFTDGCCNNPWWAPDDPTEVARAALSGGE